MAYDINIQKLVYHNSLQNKAYFTQIKPKYFENEHIQEIFKIVTKYFEKYQNYPNLATIHKMIDHTNYSKKLPHEIVDAIYETDVTRVDESWLKRVTEAFIRQRTLALSTVDLINYIQSTEITEDNIESVVNNSLRLYNEKNNINFVTDVGLDFFEVESHLPDAKSTRNSTGYDYFDMVSGGGITEGELWVLMGRTNIGKSIWLSNFAKNFVFNGYNTIYISLEMGEKDVNARIGANMFNVDVNSYYSDVDQHTIKERIKKLRRNNDEMFDSLGRLWVKKFSTSSFSTMDLESFVVNNIEKALGIKVHMIVLDYVNLMTNWRNPNSDDTYKKIKAIAEDLRAIAGANDWSIVTATQITRSAVGNSDMDLQDVSESMGLLHTADLVAGILQTPEMNIENLYDMKLLKNRRGGYINTRQAFQVNYDYMAIRQVSEPHRQGK